MATFILMKYKLHDDIITQEDLDHFDGRGKPITIQEYIRRMYEEGMIYDIVDDDFMELVEVMGDEPK